MSPLLANALLDEVDKALEARGYSFARYADDCNVYVSSKRSGERVMALLRRLYAGLKLQINEAKSAVGSALGRKFLGYELWGGPRAGKSNVQWPTRHWTTSRLESGNSRAAQEDAA